MNHREFAEYLNNHIDKLSKWDVIRLYSSAINYMQAYNGRTEFGCLAMALGLDVQRDDNGNEIYIK